MYDEVIIDLEWELWFWGLYDAYLLIHMARIALQRLRAPQG